MTYDNPNPLANPLTDRGQFGNLNFNRMQNSGYFRPCSRSQSVPDSQFTYDQYVQQQQELHVPNQDVYDGSREVLPGIVGKFVNGEMHLDYADNVWNDREILSMPREYSPMTQADYEREAYAKEQSQKLSANMSDEQRELLADIDSYLGKSKLIEESKKA